MNFAVFGNIDDSVPVLRCSGRQEAGIIRSRSRSDGNRIIFQIVFKAVAIGRTEIIFDIRAPIGKYQIDKAPNMIEHSFIGQDRQSLHSNLVGIELVAQGSIKILRLTPAVNATMAQLAIHRCSKNAADRCSAQFVHFARSIPINFGQVQNFLVCLFVEENIFGPDQVSSFLGFDLPLDLTRPVFMEKNRVSQYFRIHHYLRKRLFEALY